MFSIHAFLKSNALLDLHHAQGHRELSTFGGQEETIPSIFPFSYIVSNFFSILFIFLFLVLQVGGLLTLKGPGYTSDHAWLERVLLPFYNCIGLWQKSQTDANDRNCQILRKTVLKAGLISWEINTFCVKCTSHDDWCLLFWHNMLLE